MRPALLAVGGALLAVTASALAAWGFVQWRGSEQAAAFEVHASRCYAGDQVACDRLRAACGKHSGIACSALATRYLEGRGVPVDPGEGLRLLDEGCRSNEADACVRSAELRAAAQKEPQRAAEALRKACSLGDARGCAPQSR